MIQRARFLALSLPREHTHSHTQMYKHTVTEKEVTGLRCEPLSTTPTLAPGSLEWPGIVGRSGQLQGPRDSCPLCSAPQAWQVQPSPQILAENRQGHVWGKSSYPVLPQGCT